MMPVDLPPTLRDLAARANEAGPGPQSKEIRSPIFAPTQQQRCGGMDATADDVFFSEEGRSARPARRNYCRACPALAECMTHGLRYEAHGIWGGLSESERRSLGGLRYNGMKRTGDAYVVIAQGVSDGLSPFSFIHALETLAEQHGWGAGGDATEACEATSSSAAAA